MTITPFTCSEGARNGEAAPRGAEGPGHEPVAGGRERGRGHMRMS